MSKTLCRIIGEDLVVDPNTGNAVKYTLLMTEGGGVFGVDSSYLEQEVGPIYDPFDGRVVEIEEDDD